MSKSKSLPSPMDTEIYEAVKYVEEIQNQYEEELEGIKDQLDQIYTQTRTSILALISTKTKPFLSFVEEMAQKKKNTKTLSPREYPLKEILLMADVQQYYELGIPIAAHPKVLFNSFISKKYLQRGVNTLFVQEALKRYYVRLKWGEIIQI